MRVQGLNGALLDYWVGRAEGKINTPFTGPFEIEVEREWETESVPYSPSSDWSQGGPIIEREGIESGLLGNGEYYATRTRVYVFKAKTQLVAAMRCFVASKYGESVPCPDPE